MGLRLDLVFGIGAVWLGAVIWLGLARRRRLRELHHLFTETENALRQSESER